MKTIRIVSVLALLLIVSSPCFALVMIEPVSRERAEKDFGARIRTEMVATKQVGVWLEFSPKGKLETFSSVQLDIMLAERRVVSATLSPLKQTPVTIVVYFSTDPAYLSGSTFTVFYKSSGFPSYDGFSFKVSDFIKHGSSH